jgi:hypothetical protein
VVDESRNQIVRDVLVKQDAHWRPRSRGRAQEQQWPALGGLTETASGASRQRCCDNRSRTRSAVAADPAPVGNSCQSNFARQRPG